MTFVARCISALLLGSVVLGARADAPAPLRVRFDPNTPHMQVMRKLAWAEAEFGVAGVRWVAQDQAADVVVASGADAVAQRAAGMPVKAVFVLARSAGAYELLIVAESLIAERPDAIEKIVALHEKARKWLLAHPDDAANLLATGRAYSFADAARELARRDLSVSRPGPALSAALKRDLDAVRAGAVDGLLFDQPLRAATRRLEQVALLPAARVD